MSKLMIAPLVALLTTTACAADLSGDDDGAMVPSPEPPPQAMASTECETAAPDASFVGSPMVLGIVPDAGAPFIKLDASVFVDASGERFSIELQPIDPETGTAMGEPQEVRDVAIDPDGLFTIEEMVLELPPGAFDAVDDEQAAEGQTALADVRGGFCATTGSLQGTYDGWTFTPTAEETTGVWFVAPVAEP